MATEPIMAISAEEYMNNLLNTFRPILYIVPVATAQAVSLGFAILLTAVITALGSRILLGSHHQKSTGSRREEKVISLILIAFLALCFVAEEVQSPSFSSSPSGGIWDVIMPRNFRVCAWFAGISVPLLGIVRVGPLAVCWVVRESRGRVGESSLPERSSSSGSGSGSSCGKVGTSKRHCLAYTLLVLLLAIIFCISFPWCWTGTLGTPRNSITTEEYIYSFRKGLLRIISASAKLLVVFVSFGTTPMGLKLAMQGGCFILCDAVEECSFRERQQQQKKEKMMMEKSKKMASPSRHDKGLGAEDDGKDKAREDKVDKGNESHDSKINQINDSDGGNKPVLGGRSASLPTISTTNNLPENSYLSSEFWPLCFCLAIQVQVGIFIYYYYYYSSSSSVPYPSRPKSHPIVVGVVLNDDFFWWSMLKFMIAGVIVDFGIVVGCWALGGCVLVWKGCCGDGLPEPSSLGHVASKEEEKGEGAGKREEDEKVVDVDVDVGGEEEEVDKMATRGEFEGVKEGKWVDVERTL